ncbi:DctP family TRAP transporter solute-binding subunit [Desulfatiferula olefinivorans]
MSVWTVGLLCVLISGWPLPASSGPSEPQVVLKMATVAPKGHAMTRRMDDFNEEVKRATNNQVAFKIYWGGVQGDDSNVFRKIRLGQLHGGFFSGYSLGQIVPEVRVTEIPYLFAGDAEVAYVRDKLEADMFEYFDQKGFVVLGSFVDIGFMYLFFKQPVMTVDDMRKARCWVPGEDTLAQAFYKSMDINPVPLSVNDVMTSVSTNLIDSAGMTPFGAIAFRWYTRFKYMSDVPMLNVVGANIVTKKIWNRISPEHRRIILDIADRYCDRQKEDLRAANHESVKLLKEAGMTILQPDSEAHSQQVRFLMEAGHAARENQVGVLYSRELLNRTLSLVREYRETHGENGGGIDGRIF